MLDCLVWMRKSFLVIADAGLRRWISAMKTSAFLRVVTRQAVARGFAQSLLFEVAHSGLQMDEGPILPLEICRLPVPVLAAKAAKTGSTFGLLPMGEGIHPRCCGTLNALSWNREIWGTWCLCAIRWDCLERVVLGSCLVMAVVGGRARAFLRVKQWVVRRWLLIFDYLISVWSRFLVAAAVPLFPPCHHFPPHPR